MNFVTFKQSVAAQFAKMSKGKLFSVINQKENADLPIEELKRQVEAL